MELQETHGVCVASLGPTTDFPAFFSRKSGFHAPHNVQTTSEAADLVLTHRQIASKSGILLAVPIPDEHEEAGQLIEDAIQSALREAQEQGIAGRDVTPFVLAKVNELTSGASLKANLGLIENNALAGAKIAVEMARKSEHSARQGDSFHGFSAGGASSGSEQVSERPLVIGGSIFDLMTHVQTPDLVTDGSTHLGRVNFGYGGVGRNLADGLALFDLDPTFISAVGEDELGKNILGTQSNSRR